MQCEVLFKIQPTYKYRLYIYITASKKTELESFDCIIGHLVKMRTY